VNDQSDPTKLTEEYQVVPRRPDRKLRINESEWNRIVKAAKKLSPANELFLAIGCMIGGAALSSIFSLITGWKGLDLIWKCLSVAGLVLAAIVTLCLLIKHVLTKKDVSLDMDRIKEKIMEVDEQIMDRGDSLPEILSDQKLIASTPIRVVSNDERIQKEHTESKPPAIESQKEVSSKISIDSNANSSTIALIAKHDEAQGNRKPAVLEVDFRYAGLDLLAHGWTFTKENAPSFRAINGPTGQQALLIESEAKRFLDLLIKPKISGGCAIQFTIASDVAPTCYVKLSVKIAREMSRDFWLQVFAGEGQPELIYKNEAKVPCAFVKLSDGWLTMTIIPEDLVRPHMEPWSIESIEVKGFRLRGPGAIDSISVFAESKQNDENIVTSVLNQIKRRKPADTREVNAYVQKLRKVDGVVREFIRLVGKEPDTWGDLPKSGKFEELAAAFYRRFLAREPEKTNDPIPGRTAKLRDEYKSIGGFDRNVDDFIDSKEYWNRFGNMKIPG